MKIKFCDLLPGRKFKFLPQGKTFIIVEMARHSLVYAPISDVNSVIEIGPANPLWFSEVYLTNN